MGSVPFHPFSDAAAFWQAAEEEGRGIQVMRLHPTVPVAQFEARVRAAWPRCEFHWPRPDPGSASEHRGDCWLVFAGAGDAAYALALVGSWKLGPWHVKARPARRETPRARAPASPLPPLASPPPPSPPPDPAAAAPSPPVAFVNTTTGDVTVVTRIAQGPKGHQQPRSTGAEAPPAIPRNLLNWRSWGTGGSR